MSQIERINEQLPSEEGEIKKAIPDSRIHRFMPDDPEKQQRTTAIYGSGWGNANQELINDTMLPMAEERPVLLLDHPRAVRDDYIQAGLEKYAGQFPKHVRHLEKALNILHLPSRKA